MICLMIKPSVGIYGISKFQFQILAREIIPMAQFGFIDKPEPNIYSYPGDAGGGSGFGFVY